MARKIESLLRIVSDMQYFENTEVSTQKKNICRAPDELFEEDLDMLYAAVQEPQLPNSLDKENK